MEILLYAKYQCLSGWNLFDLICPFSRKFDGCLDCFGACVHGQDHVVAKHLGDFVCKAWEYIVVECTAAQSQSRSLVGECFDEFRVTMALIHGAIGREEVEVVFVFLSFYVSSETAREIKFLDLLDPKLLLLLRVQRLLAEGGSCGRRTWLQHPWPPSRK
jgi:hypothetical protein